ncbi:redoxin domain-containing protein [Reichenbachiella versicolor]|uniref:redoxin domain-containing protein n=1 Tax=Reichenbachiella versicolor TaxID=1821036 RepID=UPI001C87A743|nr:redoxin domain-containing protein [Reichenbachiella versicolor]
MFILLAIIANFTVLGQGKSLAEMSFYDVSRKEFLSTDQLFGDKGLVIVFTSLNCPYSQKYEGRLVKMKQKYQDQGVNVVLVNSNDPSIGEPENIPMMRARAEDLGIQYFSDQSQTIKSILKVSKNGEVVVLTRKDGAYKTLYQGAIDDNPLSDKGIKENYLQNAIDHLLDGKDNISVNYVRPIGCHIK